MNQGILLIEMHYLPCIQYFIYLNSFEKIIIDPDDTYIKQTYRNRCRINGANKIENLIIPIQKVIKPQNLTSEVKIDYQQKWLNSHIRAIKSAYGKAPFFEYYVDDFIEILSKKQERLFDLNRSLLTKCLDILELKINIEYTEDSSNSDGSRLFDARDEINPKKIINKHHLFFPVEYFQVFGKNFVGNLSIIDLIFCEGPQAKEILVKSSA